MPVKRKTKAKPAKPRASGQWTEARYWQFIRSLLRSGTRRWPPVRAVKLAARRSYKGSNPRQKWEYQCADCARYFKDDETSVDHIVPAGSLTSLDQLPAFVARLYVEKDGLQVLCDDCHSIKTARERQEKS